LADQSTSWIASPLGRFGAVEEVAPLALLLANRAASHVTGTEFRVDGGLSVSA
jgi:NAD(P)-dependent dehydrogenase (short-subunit alcohol dehydrogenase family)